MVHPMFHQIIMLVNVDLCPNVTTQIAAPQIIDGR